MADSVDCVVIGAGVVGLAVARACAQAGLETMVLEAEPAIGMHTSSRNSEVIHAGIYYPGRSLKARLCVQGRPALYRYCQERGVATWACGKLIVATHATQRFALKHLQQRAWSNGVHDLQWLEQDAILALEPDLAAVAALWSPSTGVVDSHALMLALQADFEAAGGVVVCGAPVDHGRALEPACADNIELQVGGEQPSRLRARWVVNSAGLHALTLARRFHGLQPHSLPTGRWAKGNYFSLLGAGPFSRLIYPIPQSGGLGIHLTLDLAGRARFGPDVQLTDTLDYTVDESRLQAFEQAIRRYWPALPNHALAPDYAGIRPQLDPGPEASTADTDFMIQDATDHGLAGLINLLGVESPGLTACLAIGAEVVRRLVQA